MDMPEVWMAVANRIAKVPGVMGASYPQLNEVPASPWVMVIDGNAAGPTTIRRGMNGLQEVSGRGTIRILVKSQADRPREATKIDSLITPILDALDPGLLGGNANALLPELSDTLDRIWDDVAIVRGKTLEYSGEFCYAADIGIDPFFTREPQEILP